MRTWANRTVVVVIALVALVAASCSDPGSSATSDSVEDTSVELFDPSMIHSIDVQFDEATYDDMIQTFADTGDKEWIEATVTVDGVTYERAGLRLKGNSSLMGLGNSASAPDDPDAGETGSTQDTEVPPADDVAPRGPGGFGAGADADTPEELPWLIRLDEFVPDQLHQGYADIVVRSNNSETSLNEAVALDPLDATPLASQLPVSTTFAVNDGDPVLRLAIEHPDDDAWQERAFSTEGALYKAESGGDWSYRGDDPEAYVDVFDQEGGKEVADLTPLIEFLRFINESTDEEFADDLDQYLDVDSFATYLAMMELLDNFDDIDGPGNNAYLWWDASTEQFTIVPWDLNLAFGQFGAGGAGHPGGVDPDSLPDGMQPPAGMELPDGIDPDDLPDPGQLPEGVDPSQLPQGGGPPGGGGQAGPGAFGGGNVLVERFLENADFEQLYQERLDYFRSDLFDSGAADELLDARVATLATEPDVVAAATVDEEAATLRESITSVTSAGD